jgi:cysteine desulfurase/selenocysteine lyase
MTSLPITKIRADFPILAQKMNQQRLCYFDSAGSALKPLAVMNAMNNCAENYYANIHRGVYEFSVKTTDAYEGARQKVASFIGAQNAREVIFTKGTTEAINLVAHSWAEAFLKKGDVILLSELEHHANIVPWQMVCERVGSIIKVIPITDDGSLDMATFESLLTPEVKFMALTQMSNALGTLPDVKGMIQKARAHCPEIKVLIDGSQSVVHLKIDVLDLDTDFFVFTGHKLYGPTGIGVCWGRFDLLSQMPPYQTGGDMISRVSFERTTFKEPPTRFEAGTPPILEAIGLGAAIDYLTGIGLDAIHAHENAMFQILMEQLQTVPKVKIFGSIKDRAGLISFALDEIHPHDIGTCLDQQGVAIRAGHHCTQPLMTKLGVPATARASLGLYNNEEDIAQFIKAVKDTVAFFG